MALMVTFLSWIGQKSNHYFRITIIEQEGHKNCEGVFFKERSCRSFPARKTWGCAEGLMASAIVEFAIIPQYMA
jgi:hypothetical protein